MSRSKMSSGTPILVGDNTIPGTPLHKELVPLIPKIEEACKSYGLDYYPIVVEMVSYSDMAELASYNGFPNRYPHWSFGMTWEDMSRGYEYGQYRISEMVINNSPCYIYCMDSNTVVDNVDVIFHAIGHNDFFKNNVYYSKTNRNMMDKLANHGTAIRRYIKNWGDEKVTAFIDDVLRIQTLIDPASAWKKKEPKENTYKDKRKYHFPNLLKTEHNYMDSWLNPDDYVKKEKERVENEDIADQLDLFKKPERDIFRYLKDYAPLKPWQQDIISMLYEEALYFAPQWQTKMLNEGWASFIDFHFLSREGFASLGQKSPDMGIVQYAIHKMHVLGGKYSQNPYKTGFDLLLDIEDRWNKGKFGQEYDECRDINKKKNWDLKLGLGKEKVFEVRECCNDFTTILHYFTKEFCEKHEYYEYEHFPNGDWVIISKDYDTIKERLLRRYLDGGRPDVRLMDPNHLGKGWFLMEHYWNEVPLYDPDVREVLTSIYRIWNNNVVLVTKSDDEQDIVYVCTGPELESVGVMTYGQYVDKYMGDIPKRSN